MPNYNAMDDPCNGRFPRSTQACVGWLLRGGSVIFIPANQYKGAVMSPFARQSSVFARLLAVCSLALVAALPLSAWAVDTDGDGVDDSIDAFPANAEATTDTDSDGKPDSIDQSRLPVIFSDSFDGSVADGWTGVGTRWLLDSTQAHSGSGSLAGGSQNGGAASLSRVVTIPAEGGTISYWHKKYVQLPITYDSKFNGYLNSLFLSGEWVKSTYALSAGTPTLSWVARCGGSFGTTRCGWLDDVEVRANSTLIEDADDDNDGIPDAFDPAPLNTNGIWPLNGSYKGSVVSESQGIVP